MRITDISRKSKASNYVKDEFVQPIRRKKDRDAFKNYWLNHCAGNSGRKNWTIFSLGIITALRASDIVKLKVWQVYDNSGNPRNHIISQIDQKTQKHNDYLNIKSIKKCLHKYMKWRHSRGIYSQWMFPRKNHHHHHITSDYIYRMMSSTGDKIGIKHLGSQSLRKTFGYLAYKQTHNIVYVMKRLNHSNPQVTLRYIGMNNRVMDKITESLDFKQLNE